MNINRPTLWTTLAVALLAAVALVTLSAQAQEPPQGRRPRMGEARGFGPGPGQGPILPRLNLTEQQREQVRAIMQESREAGEVPGQKIGQLRRELRAAVFADAPDAAKIEQLKAAIAEAEAAALDKRVETELKIAQVLTAEQRAEAREMPAGRAGRGPRRGLKQ
jgi:Spy/CpxP family protein refolding chaperone